MTIIRILTVAVLIALGVGTVGGYNLQVGATYMYNLSASNINLLEVGQKIHTIEKPIENVDTKDDKMHLVFYNKDWRTIATKLNIKGGIPWR